MYNLEMGRAYCVGIAFIVCATHPPYLPSIQSNCCPHLIDFAPLVLCNPFAASCLVKPQQHYSSPPSELQNGP